MGAFTAAGERVWPIPPDWSGGVQEGLSWLSDTLVASATAVSQHRALRTGPRRSFTFDVLVDGQDRRAADMLLAGHGGVWLLPIWPDVQFIGLVTAGATFVPCETAGFDFVAGGKALIWAGLNTWVVVQISAIGAGGIALIAPVMGSWPAGARLYPLRRARVQNGAEEILRNDTLSRRTLAFDIVEPCDWPALADAPMYLSHLVLDVRPDESDDPAASYARLLAVVDNETALPMTHDVAGVALRAQQSSWKLSGRPEHTWFRSLLYSLAGRCTPIWVPSFASDLKPLAAVGAGSTVLTVEWAGYELFGKGKQNRKDIRIELRDGTRYYRRIVNAVESGAYEVLTLNASLSASSIPASSIRSISFMALCTAASDDVEIDHVTDQSGIATSTTGWQAVVPDV